MDFIKGIEFEFLLICLLLTGLLISVFMLAKFRRMVQKERSCFGNILESIPLGFVMVDSTGKVIFENKKSVKILGCSIKELRGITERELLDLFTDNGKQKVEDSGEGNNYPEGTTVQVQNKDGNCLQLCVNVIKSEGGYFYVFRDIPKASELHSMLSTTQTIINAITNILMVCDKNGKIILGNKALADCLEMELTEIIGLDIMALNEFIQTTHPKGSASFTNINEGEPREISLTTFKGNRKSILVYQSALTNPAGEIIGYIFVGTDITLIKEEQYKIMQNEKLVTVGQMAAGIVHEIRNPLTAIKGFSQIIQKLASDKKILECARFIDSEANNMNKVVTDFLRFARPSPPVLKEVVVRELLESMKLIVESNSFIRKIDVHFQYNKEDVTVLADEDQLRQVILNLAQNAMDAMANTPKPVLNIVSGYNKSTMQVYIAVSDNGKGMTHDECLKAGTPFFTTKDRGTGLGLSVCFQIIREHGGHIKIDSTPGEGTTVTIFLDPAEKIKEKISIA